MKIQNFFALVLALSCSALYAETDGPTVDKATESAAFENSVIQNMIENIALNHRISDGASQAWPFSVEHHVKMTPTAQEKITSFKTALGQELRLPPSTRVFSMSFENYEGEVPNPKLYLGSKAAMSITFYNDGESKYLRYNIFLDENQKLRGVERDIIHPARNVKKHGGGGGGDNHNTEWILIRK